VPKSVNTTHVMTWNVLQGGGKRRPRILGQIAESKAAVIGLTEIRRNNLDAWTIGLQRLGYTYIEHSCPEGEDGDLTHSVLIASRVPLQRVELEQVEDPARWTAVYIPSLDVHLLCVHIPGTPDDKVRPGTYSLLGVERKQLMWEAVMRHIEPRKDKRLIVMGDFNTGRNDIDKSPEGTPYKCAQFIDRLQDLGMLDTFRTLHPTKREYTWYSRSKRGRRDLNGFRLDHIFVSTALSYGIVATEHVHHVRGPVAQGKLSDHAIVIAELDLTVMALELIA
jgi:exodeoxyribonuclease-3